MGPIELVAAVLTLLNVWLVVRQSMWCWPIGAVSVALYFFVFLEAKYYADTGLQVFYFGMQFYGWYQWLYGGKERSELTVTRIPRGVAAVLAVATLGFAGTLGYLLDRYTDAALPYVDCTMTSMSLAAQWMMARKYLENWPVWIAVNVISIPLYSYRQLWSTVVLYSILLILAVKGYVDWKRETAAT